MALVTLVAGGIVVTEAGVSMRDPGDITVARLTFAAMLLVLVALADILVRAWRESAGAWPSRAALIASARDRWTLQRIAVVAIALISFYVTYFAYRNLKSTVPLIRPGDIFDTQLADVDRFLFAGNDPSELLHSLLGTGAVAHLLSSVYMLFFLFIPVVVAFALVVTSDVRVGLFVTLALSLNWALGAASYFVFPSLGPIYADPSAFAALPETQVSDLQSSLISGRESFLADPTSAGATQSIGAFASLHTSILFTAALAAHLLGLHRRVKIVAWALTGLTMTATMYFGWHNLLDDFAGIAIAVAALSLARLLTGVDLAAVRPGHREQALAEPAPA